MLEKLKRFFSGGSKYISINGTKIDLDYKEASAALNPLIGLAPNKETRKVLQDLYVACLKEYEKEQEEEEEIVIDISEEEEVTVSLGLRVIGEILSPYHIVLTGVIIAFLSWHQVPIPLTMDQINVPRTELISHSCT